MIQRPMYFQGGAHQLVSLKHIQGLNHLDAVQVEIDQMPMGNAGFLLGDKGQANRIQSTEIRAMLSDRKRKDRHLLLSFVVVFVCGCLSGFGLSRL